jgi:multicomponent Na+:H+ antiporter subunit D
MDSASGCPCSCCSPRWLTAVSSSSRWREERFVRLRTALNLAGAVLKLVLVASWSGRALRGVDFETRLPFLPGLDLVLRVDFMALLFGTLSAVLWLLTTIYAIGYLEGSPHRSRFFGFFSLCVMATMGIALAGNLITFLLFYELLTVVTFPLVVHRGTRRAAGGRPHLPALHPDRRAAAAGSARSGCTCWPVPSSSRRRRGSPRSPTSTDRPGAHLRSADRGLGVKAAIVPLHGWLPVAMVAPGAGERAAARGRRRQGGRVRHRARRLRRVRHPLRRSARRAHAARRRRGITIFYGSLRALAQDDLKRRLAYSTVSQLSYIVLGVAPSGQLATIGGSGPPDPPGHHEDHPVLLRRAAGRDARHQEGERDGGVGRRMPLTMTAFTSPRSA